MYQRILRNLALQLCIHFSGLCLRVMYLKTIWEQLLQRVNQQTLAYAVLVGLIALSYAKIQSYGGLRFEQLLTLMMLPFTLSGQRQITIKWPVFLSLLSFVLYYLTNTYSAFYLGLGFALLSCLWYTPNKPSILSIILVIISTPALKSLLHNFSFPLRMQLTKMAGQILSHIYTDIETMGNTIQMDNQCFSVAPECLGLNLLTSGLAFAVFVLALYARKFHKQPTLKLIIGFLILALLLTIIANLSRIILTVILSAQQDTILHELIGILIFVFNTCLPLLIIGYFTRKYFQKISPPANKNTSVLWLLVFPILTGGTYSIQQNTMKASADPIPLNLEGFTKSISTDNVVKYVNDSALIYIKPPAFVLGSDHNPFICWKASGYTIKNENISTINHQKVFTFELHNKHNEVLHSCWWYSNGDHHTSSQLEWRMATIKGEAPFCVMNVTSEDPHITRSYAAALLQ